MEQGSNCNDTKKHENITNNKTKDRCEDDQFTSSGTRRNALTPESHHIEPIRQTEIQEKMSNLTMTISGDIDSDSNNNNNPDQHPNG